jgi:hypothetical protein
MEHKRPAMRNLLSALWCLVIAANLAPLAAAQRSSDDELFTSTNVPSIAIEIPEAGIQVLRQYHWRRDSEDDPPPPREDVRVTVREGTTVYTNVALHLKGSAGSFPSDRFRRTSGADAELRQVRQGPALSRLAEDSPEQLRAGPELRQRDHLSRTVRPGGRACHPAPPTSWPT